VYEWPFQLTLPQTTEYYRADGREVDKHAGFFVSGPHRLPPCTLGAGPATSSDCVNTAIEYGLLAKVEIDRSLGKRLYKSVPIMVSSWLEESSSPPVLTARYPLGHWQRWNGPLHQRLFMHAGSSSGSVSPVVEFGAFIDLLLPRHVQSPMSLALSIRQDQSVNAAVHSLQSLVLIEVHLILREHWRERMTGRVMLSATPHVMGTRNATYSHVIPADGTPLMLISDMTFESFVRKCKLTQYCRC